jgi:hypothetical protein
MYIAHILASLDYICVLTVINELPSLLSTNKPIITSDDDNDNEKWQFVPFLSVDDDDVFFFFLLMSAVSINTTSTRVLPWFSFILFKTTYRNDICSVGLHEVRTSIIAQHLYIRIRCRAAIYLTYSPARKGTFCAKFIKEERRGKRILLHLIFQKGFSRK